MTELAYTDEADDWEYQPFEAADPVASGYITIDSRKPNETRRKLRGSVTNRRVVRPSAAVQRPKVGDKHELTAKERTWVHETLFVPLEVQGRSTAEFAGKPAHQFAAWQWTGKLKKSDLAHAQAGDAPWTLDELADREIVWFMTQELPPEAGWLDRWIVLGVTKGRQRQIVMKHSELAFELLALCP